MKVFFTVLALLMFAASPSAVLAGVLVVESSESLQGGDGVRTSKIYIDGDRIRAESWSEDRQHVFIYRADRETIWMVDPKNKTYREMTKQDLDRMMGQVSDQMAQMRQMMEERMKNMPPEQRKMVEQMMKGKMGAPGMGAPQPAKTVYQKVASGEQVNQWTCDKYEGVRDGEKHQDVWTTDYQQFGLEASDFQVLQELGRFFESLAPANSDALFKVGSAEAEQEQGYAGVPVRRISYRNGRPDRKSEVTELLRQDFEDSLFEPPAGFDKQTMPAVPSPGGRGR